MNIKRLFTVILCCILSLGVIAEQPCKAADIPTHFSKYFGMGEQVPEKLCRVRFFDDEGNLIHTIPSAPAGGLVWFGRNDYYDRDYNVISGYSGGHGAISYEKTEKGWSTTLTLTYDDIDSESVEIYRYDTATDESFVMSGAEWYQKNVVDAGAVIIPRGKSYNRSIRVGLGVDASEIGWTTIPNDPSGLVVSWDSGFPLFGAFEVYDDIDLYLYIPVSDSSNGANVGIFQYGFGAHNYIFGNGSWVNETFGKGGSIGEAYVVTDTEGRYKPIASSVNYKLTASSDLLPNIGTPAGGPAEEKPSDDNPHGDSKAEENYHVWWSDSFIDDHYFESGAAVIGKEEVIEKEDLKVILTADSSEIDPNNYEYIDDKEIIVIDLQDLAIPDYIREVAPGIVIISPTPEVEESQETPEVVEELIALLDEIEEEPEDVNSPDAEQPVLLYTIITAIIVGAVVFTLLEFGVWNYLWMLLLCFFCKGKKKSFHGILTDRPNRFVDVKLGDGKLTQAVINEAETKAEAIESVMALTSATILPPYSKMLITFSGEEGVQTIESEADETKMFELIKDSEGVVTVDLFNIKAKFHTTLTFD